MSVMQSLASQPVIMVASSQKVAQFVLIGIVEVLSVLFVGWLLYHILGGVFGFLGELLNPLALAVMAGVFAVATLIALACGAQVGTALIVGGAAVGIVIVFEGLSAL